MFYIIDCPVYTHYDLNTLNKLTYILITTLDFSNYYMLEIK